jgi:hypothetical protein
MPRLRVIEANTVDEDEHLSERGAAYREIGLNTVNAARANVHRRRQTQHIGDGVSRETGNLLTRDDRHRPRHRCQFHRLGRPGDDDGLSERVLSRRHGLVEPRAAQQGCRRQNARSYPLSRRTHRAEFYLRRAFAPFLTSGRVFCAPPRPNAGH